MVLTVRKENIYTHLGGVPIIKYMIQDKKMTEIVVLGRVGEGSGKETKHMK